MIFYKNKENIPDLDVKITLFGTDLFYLLFSLCVFLAAVYFLSKFIPIIKVSVIALVASGAILYLGKIFTKQDEMKKPVVFSSKLMKLYPFMNHEVRKAIFPSTKFLISFHKRFRRYQ
jgi:hypothetical protein